MKNSKSSILYQIRIDLSEKVAPKVRKKNLSVLNNNIIKILNKVNAELICQFDAFDNFVTECEKEGEIDNALYKWTKDTIMDEKKIKKYSKSFTIYVKGDQLYEKKIADYLELEIKRLKEKNILKINKYNSDPKNNPQPPKKYF